MSAKCTNADKPDVIAKTFAIVDCVCSDDPEPEPNANRLALSTNERERYENKKTRTTLENPSYGGYTAEFYKEKGMQMVVNFEGKTGTCVSRTRASA